MTTQRMLSNFAQYVEPELPLEHRIVGMPLGSRCKRIERLQDGWRIWLATQDYIYGTFLTLFDGGEIQRTTTRQDEGDDVFVVRPTDDEIRRKLR
jgi:hypothetical protein